MKLDMCINPLIQGSVKQLYNTTKNRFETWIRAENGDREFVLCDICPGRVWWEQFQCSIDLAPAVLGLSARLQWAVNGRRNGANAPNENCFTGANDIGGGLQMGVIAGGQDNDYTAIHWNSNFPVVMRKSPHFKFSIEPEQTTSIGVYKGLVDDTRAASTDAFTLPDNAILIGTDTDVDNNHHYIIRSGGVEVVNQTLEAISTNRSTNFFQTTDDGLSVRLIRDGAVVVDWIDISGAAFSDLRSAQLQPYAVIISRAADTARSVIVHDIKLIMDRGY